MSAFLKRRYLTLALLPCVALVPLISYFAIARNRSRVSTTHSKQIESHAATSSASATGPRSVSVDSDSDGIPDVAELQSFSDRDSFRQWFTLISEAQFYELSEQWNADQGDCAGLVRFAWRESLRRHDRAWFQKMGRAYRTIAPDVQQYNLEQGPLAEKIFRTSFGSYKDGEISNGVFSEFADARTLKSFNTKFVSRDRRQAEPGDLLFFHQPWVQKFPYHVMIFLGRSKLSDEEANDWVVYHTGSSATDDGVVKKVQLAVLDHHPNQRWRPVESNPNFLGFYRLKILD